MVGASFTVAASAQILRSKKGITAIGNAQIDTAQSQFGGSSYLGDGTGDYLSVSPLNSFAFGTGDYTIEFWFRSNGAITSNVLLLDARPASGNGAYPAIYLPSSVPTYYVSSANRITGTTTLSANTWYHLAISRSGTSTKMFLNGTQEGSTWTDTTDYLEPPYWIIGAQSYTLGSASWNGWIDEFRVSNSARYTANFTPSTTPFVNDANTLLLIHANGTDATTFFEDDNGVRASRSLIATGNAQVDTAQSKFGGSSLLCDGTGDYVVSPAGTQWDFSSSSFTIEYWIRFNVAPTLYVPIALRESASIFNGEWWCEITNAEKKMYWGFKNQAGTQYYVNLALAGTAFATGQWYHIALVNNAGTAQMYVNGTATGATTSLSGSFGNSSTNLWVGAGAGAYSLNGWMDEVRISNTARYTGNFTAPTAPFVNDANTLVLIHADGTDASTVFRDDNGSRKQIGIQALGNAQIDTAQSKFGGASALFDGTGDYLTASTGADLTDLTVEFWYRANSLPGSGLVPLISFNNTLMYIGYSGANTVYDFYNSSSRISLNAVTINTGTWYNVAFVRSGGNITVYHNGTSVATGSSWTAAVDWGTYGAEIAKYSTYYLNGWIDELRISNTARYTANFTPSTTPLQNDSNTLLLLHMDGTDGSTVFFDDNGIAPYTP
jgi:hypothetical protein